MTVKYTNLNNGSIRVHFPELDIDVIADGKDPIITKNGLLGPKPDNRHSRVDGVYLYDPKSPDQKGQQLYGKIKWGKGIDIPEILQNMEKARHEAQIEDYRRSLDCYGNSD